MVVSFLASHNGSSARAITEAIQAGKVPATGGCLISNNEQSVALQWAREYGLPTYHLSSRNHPDSTELDSAIYNALTAHNTSIVLLSGYMKKLGPATLTAFHQRILNVHPSLLPRYGGQGMYGDRVHEAVLAAGEKETGITVHLVDEHYDHGKIVAQCRIPVISGDTVDSLRTRVQAREKGFYIEVLEGIVSGRYLLD